MTQETAAHLAATATIVVAMIHAARGAGFTMNTKDFAPGDVSRMIEEVRGALLNEQTTSAAINPVNTGPAVPVKKSVTPDAVTCLHCGTVMKSLKRHIGTVHGQSPDEYRKAWGLPADHPIVAPNYSARRSELAKTHGLGRK